MEISGPLNLVPSAARSPNNNHNNHNTRWHETSRYKPPRMDQMPRTFASATSTITTRLATKVQNRDQDSPLPPTSDVDYMWKVSREFQETFQAYREQQPIDISSTQEEEKLDLEDQPPNATFENDHHYNYYTSAPSERRNQSHPHTNNINMARQQETVSIGLDPRQQQQHVPSQPRKTSIEERPAPEYTWEVRSSHMSTNNTAPTSYRSTLKNDSSSSSSPKKPQQAIEPTITEFYAPHHPQTESTDDDANLLYTIAPDLLLEEEQLSAADFHTNWDTTPTTTARDFERPRAVPYNHRETQLVVKEDIDFFLALLQGDQSPPGATEGTQRVVERGDEGKKTAEAEARRSEELVATQTDLEFWNMLMKA